MFIEGYYSDNGMMDNEGKGGCLYLAGLTADSSIADSVILSFVDAHSGIVVASSHGLLRTDGTAIFSFGQVNPDSYFLKVNHRNSIETWSSLTVDLTTQNSYDFTDAQTRAYGSNEIETKDNNVWAFYSGDIADNNSQLLQDGIISIQDLNEMETEVGLILIGYVPADLTGDIIVQSNDYLILNNNFNSTVMVMRP